MAFLKSKKTFYNVIILLILVYLSLTLINYEYLSHSRSFEIEKEFEEQQKEIKNLNFELQQCKDTNRKIFREEEKEEEKAGSGAKRRQLLNPLRDLPVSKTPQIKNEADKYRGKDPVEVVLYAGGWGAFTGVGRDEFHKYLGHEVKRVDCGLPCIGTNNRDRLKYADALVFEAQPFASYSNEFVRKPPEFPQKYPDQIFVNNGYEQPHYFHLYAHPGYLIHHEINMTYLQTDQVPVTFHCLWGGTTKEDFLKPPPPKSNDKLIAWFGTNCVGGAGHVLRAEWVSEFMKYADLHSYGKCLHNKDLPKEMQFPIYSDHGKSMMNKITIYQQYKFVLAFENHNITDYVTEKIMNAFQAGSVPVYIGSDSIDHWVPGPKSFIKASDFSSLRELAEYLNYLNTHDEEYMKYFEWKKVGISEEFEQKIDNCLFYASGCRLCQKISDMRDIRREQKKKEGAYNPKVSEMNYGYAVTLDGNSWIEVSHSPDFDVSEQFTLSAWVFPTKVVPMRIIDKNTAGVIDGYSFDLQPSDDDQLAPRLCAGNACYLSATPIPVNRWTFLAAVVSETYVKLYINSEVKLTEPTTSPTRTNTLPVCFGKPAEGVGNFFEGYLDDISIWGRILSKREVRRLSFQILQGNERGLIGFWSFNEGSGTEAADHTVENHLGIFKGNIKHFKSETKPLILPNAKKRPWDPLDPFLPDV